MRNTPEEKYGIKASSSRLGSRSIETSTLSSPRKLRGLTRDSSAVVNNAASGGEFRCNRVSGVWSVHFPIVKQNEEKPVGYSKGVGRQDELTHLRPVRSDNDPFDVCVSKHTPTERMVVADPEYETIPMIRVFDNKFPVNCHWIELVRAFAIVA